MIRVLALVAVLPAIAMAQVPQKLGYQGRILKSDGAPEGGVLELTFGVYGSAIGGSALWTEKQTVALADGFYSVFLGEVSSLPGDLFDGSERHLDLAVGSTALTPRQRMASVPYAITARNVAGGKVDAAAVYVGGQQVIDSTGKWVGSATGLQGPEGPRGPVGEKGDPGVAGSKGDKGDPGVAGAKGDPGVAGAKGDTGAAGAKGDKGDTGAVGAKGDTGRAGNALAVQYELDETSGTLFADASGNGFTATAPVGGLAAGSGGHTGKSVNFSGGVLAVAAPNLIPDSPQIWVEAWIQPALPLNVKRTILTRNGIYKLQQDNDAIVFSVTTTLGTCSVTSPNKVTAGVWGHVAGWYDGLNVIAAVNGKTTLSSCTNGPVSASGGAALYVGGILNPVTSAVTEDYAGRVDEVRIRLVAPMSVSRTRTHYMQWGTQTCTAVGAQTLLAAGFTFANHYTHGGGSQDLNCLKANAVAGDARSYQGDILYSMTIEGGSVHRGVIQNSTKIRCASCLAQGSVCFRIDGDHACPTGFTAQYAGYLYGSHYTHGAPYQRACIDHLNYDNGTGGQTGAYLYPTSVQDPTGTGITNTTYVKCAVCCGD